MVFLFVSSLAMAESSIDLQSMSDEDLHFLLSSIEEELKAREAAESASDPDIERITKSLEDDFSKNYDYYNIIYNDKLNMFVVDIAFDGLMSMLIEAKNQGHDENMSEWVQMKDVMFLIYDAEIEFFKLEGREDIKLMFQIVNDDAFIHKDYSTIIYNPLFSISRMRTVLYDFMAE